MIDTVYDVKTNITIYFKNNTSYNLPLLDNNNNNLTTYCKSIKITEQLYNNNNNNIVGNISGNNLVLQVTSMDKLLVSTNEQSAYFGYMDDTAYIDVTCTYNNIEVSMGRYYVTSWENGTSSKDYNDITITCTNLLGKIKNISLRKMRLTRNISVTNYLVYVINILNNQLPASMQINYNLNDLKIFKNSSYTWQLIFNNIDRDTLEATLNSIAQNTLSHIWIDRLNYLKTDWLCDDAGDTPVTQLNSTVNILDYGTDLSEINKASGVGVTYVENTSYEDKELLNISEYELIIGNNIIENLILNSNKIYNISDIEIICESGYAYCTSIFSYKNTLDLTIIASTSTICSIKVYGTVINEATNNLVKYKDNNYKSSTINIVNNILRKEIIPTFVDGVVHIASLKNSKVYATGWINPEVKLGDIVKLQGSNMGVDNLYKVIGLEFTLGLNYRVKASLLRTFDIPQDVNSILYDHNKVLIEQLGGMSKLPADIKLLNNNEEELAAIELGSDLEDLQDVIYGGT